jgi:hypothetical protein
MLPYLPKDPHNVLKEFFLFSHTKKSRLFFNTYQILQFYVKQLLLHVEYVLDIVVV